jgi:hypothetical protein
MASCAIGLLLLVVPVAKAQVQPAKEIPHLAKRGTATQLIVDGKPLLMLAGELRNSATSSMEHMQTLWPLLVKANLNTVLAPVTWELVEPEAGRFDYSLVDGLLDGARRHHLRLVLLWFASWKNAVSDYPPLWVKTDWDRFPHAQDKSGKALAVLTTFSDANREADARAFAALMRHLREVDGTTHTVVMMQVENEVGLYGGDARDYCPAAVQAFAGQVPKPLIAWLVKYKDRLGPELRKRWEASGFKTSGTWAEVFGAGSETDEIFMAWNYASYIGRVAAAGKAQYPLPMFVNAWLPGKNAQPGRDYPSGGPLAHLLDIWQAGGPQIDILAPDNYGYGTAFEERCKSYTRAGNPLFIPETSHTAFGAVNMFSAFGNHDAMGYSPFAVEKLIDPDSPHFAALDKSYAALSQLAPLILQHQGRGAMAGAMLDKAHPTRKLTLGGYTLELDIARYWAYPPAEYPAVILIAVASDEFVVAGSGATVAFTPNTPGPPRASFARVDEGKFVDGRWIPRRRLNGDEIDNGRQLRLDGDRFMIQWVKLYRHR